jgi:hypothetical protein
MLSYVLWLSAPALWGDKIRNAKTVRSTWHIGAFDGVGLGCVCSC